MTEKQQHHLKKLEKQYDNKVKKITTKIEILYLKSRESDSWIYNYAVKLVQSTHNCHKMFKQQQFL